MKSLTVVSAIVLCILASCGAASANKELKGYPVYKFLNFGGINQKKLVANQAKSKELLGEAYEPYVKRHGQYVAAGFDGHTPLRIRTESGEEVEIYVRDENSQQLWKTSPHDLAERKKSHWVKIQFVEVKVGDESVKRAVSFQAVLVDKQPIIRK